MSQASKRPRRNEPSPPGQPEEVTEETNVIDLTMDDDVYAQEKNLFILIQPLTINLLLVHE